jgi:hypothetical protein
MVCCFTGGAWLMTGQAAVTKVTKCDLTMHPRQALLVTVLQAWLDVLKPASIVVSVEHCCVELGSLLLSPSQQQLQHLAVLAHVQPP